MKRSRANSLLAALAAPMLVIGGYAALLRPTWTTQVEAAQRELARWQPAADRPVAESSPTDPAAIERERADLVARWQSLSAGWSDPAGRPEVVRRLTQLLGEQGVVVQRSAADPGEETSGLLAPALRELAQRMVRAGAAEPALWRLEVAGSWSAVMASLDLVAAARWFVLPVGIRILPRAEASDFEVTLWLWI